MSIPHQFGGDWTEHKLQALKKYLEAYMTIFTGNERARYFDTVYVDAFAGTGYRTLTNPQEQELFEELRQDDNQRYLEGSAKIALGIKKPFNKYIFIEKSRKRVRELEKLRGQYPQQTIEIYEGDANKELEKWIRQTNWKKLAPLFFSIRMACRSIGH